MYCSHWKTGANTSSKHYYHIDLHWSREIDYDIFAAFQLCSELHIHAPSCIQFIKFLLMITVLSASLRSLQPTGHNLAPTHESSSAYVTHKMYFLRHMFLSVYTEIHSQKKTFCLLCVFYSRISTMKTRLGCLSNKSDSYSDFSEFLPPAHETAARCLKWVCQKIWGLQQMKMQASVVLQNSPDATVCH